MLQFCVEMLQSGCNVNVRFERNRMSEPDLWQKVDFLTQWAGRRSRRQNVDSLQNSVQDSAQCSKCTVQSGAKCSVQCSVVYRTMYVQCSVHPNPEDWRLSKPEDSRLSKPEDSSPVTKLSEPEDSRVDRVV